MREILFHGKRIDNEEWVEGSLLIDGEAHKPAENENVSFSKCYIVPETDRDNIRTRFNDGAFYLNTISYHIIPETVGQFTGLTDKNGKKIFEGDIVHILGNQQVEDWKNVDYNALIAFLDGGFCAIDGTIEDHGFRRYALSRMDFDLEVIGNIHDNPELLEVPDDA